MKKCAAIILLLVIAALPALARIKPAEASIKGFMVFSKGYIHNYTLGADKKFTLKATAEAGEDFEDYAACAGSLYSVNALLGTIVKLDGDLKEAVRIKLKAPGDITRFLGSDGKYLFILADNRVTALTPELDPVAAIDLKPEKLGNITPVISPIDFDIHDGKEYLLANTGDIFIIDINDPKNPVAARIAVIDRDRPPELRAQWIDPDTKTLNVLAAIKTEERDPALAPNETRIIERQYVYTYHLENMDKKPSATSIYEKRQIYKSVTGEFMDHMQQQNQNGVIIDRMSPYRPDGEPWGVYISKLSKGTPCVADAFFQEKGVLVYGADFVILESEGRVQTLEVFRDIETEALWFRHKGKVNFIYRDPRRWILHIYPHILYNLLGEDVMKAKDVQFLAY
ncbi:MAG: hypothetical protein P1P89_02570 [Desulfobacterales bacterium]|nr:hypothetical protein [Desulfobacterales bacterium]